MGRKATHTCSTSTDHRGRRVPSTGVPRFASWMAPLGKAPRTCITCGRVASHLRRARCSACYEAWRRVNAPPNATCAVCSRAYFRRSCAAPTGATCSRACFATWKRGKNAKNEPTDGALLLERVCECCGTPFRAERRHVEKGNARFCSPACNGERRRAPRGSHRCEHCGAAFEQPVRLGLFAAVRFCSKACQREFMAVNAVDREPARSRAYRHLRDAVICAHPRCSTCGVAADLVVHHVVSSRKRPDLLLEPTNLVVLCRGCHTRLHTERGDTAHREAAS